MAYNRRNFLIKVIEVQDIYLAHRDRGVSAIWVYNNLIKPTYHISKRTFVRWMGINAKKELKQLDYNVEA
ncbi:hypothetical protein [uncultured Draconibacterium sp.]|uniref:hypothetical protein n=1 Tax=uncultured Draconibacterium sp. TaxID=1573823 RepID=UPI003216242D